MLRAIVLASITGLAACARAPDDALTRARERAGALPISSADAGVTHAGWVGRHVYAGPPDRGEMLTYEIDVAANGTARVSIDGADTMRRITARVDERSDGARLSVAFEAYAADDVGRGLTFHPDDVLVTIERRAQGNTLHFEKLESMHPSVELLELPSPPPEQGRCVPAATWTESPSATETVVSTRGTYSLRMLRDPSSLLERHPILVFTPSAAICGPRGELPVVEFALERDDVASPIPLLSAIFAKQTGATFSLHLARSKTDPLMYVGRLAQPSRHDRAR